MSVLDEIDRVEDWSGVDTIIFKDGSFYRKNHFVSALIEELEKCYSEITDHKNTIAELAWPENCEHEFIEVKNEKVSGVKLCIHCHRVESI